MNITKESFEKHFRNRNTLTVYSPDNIPLTISKEQHIINANGTQFEMDCKDLADYCRMLGLTIHPTTKN